MAIVYLVALAVGAALMLTWHYGLMHRLMESGDGFADGPGADRVLLRGLGLALLGMLGVFLVQAVTAILALRWHHAAHANLQRAGLQGMRWSPGWAVAGWLIPYANLVIPFLAMRETWRGSHAEHPTGWADRPVPSWIGWWWGLWVGGSTLSMVVHFSLVFSTLRSPLPGVAVFLVDLVATAVPYGFALALWLRLLAEVSEAQVGLAARSGRTLA
jgi:hypothetical protein